MDFSSLGIQAFLAFLPILLAGVLLVGFRIPAKWAMPAVYVAAVAVALGVWQMEWVRVAAASIVHAVPRGDRGVRADEGRRALTRAPGGRRPHQVPDGAGSARGAVEDTLFGGFDTLVRLAGRARTCSTTHECDGRPEGDDLLLHGALLRQRTG